MLSTTSLRSVHLSSSYAVHVSRDVEALLVAFMVTRATAIVFALAVTHLLSVLVTGCVAFLITINMS